MEYLKNRLVRYVKEAPVISCDKLLFANYPLIISPGYPVPPSLEISDYKKWTDENEEIAERQWGNNRSLIKKEKKNGTFWTEPQMKRDPNRPSGHQNRILYRRTLDIRIKAHQHWYSFDKRKSFGKESRCCNCVVTPRSVWLLQWPCSQVGVDSLISYLALFRRLELKNIKPLPLSGLSILAIILESSQLRSHQEDIHDRY